MNVLLKTSHKIPDFIRSNTSYRRRGHQFQRMEDTEGGLGKDWSDITTTLMNEILKK